MAKVQISRSHSLDHGAIRNEVEALAAKFAEDLSASYRWRGERLVFERSGASGFIEVGEGDVQIEIKLGLLLTPLKPTIETKIESYLDEALG